MGYEYQQDRNIYLDAALGRNEFTVAHVFGRAPHGVQQSPTDMWDRADNGPTQSIWLVPDQAETHDIVSTSTDDADGGIGATVVRIWGLTAWDALIESEEVTLTGTTPAPTAKQWVVIHDMLVVSHGDNVGQKPNIGTITATGQIGGRVAAAVLAGEGQAHMAVYAVPEGCRLTMLAAYAGMLRAGAGSSADVTILANNQPESTPNIFRRLGTLAITSAGNSSIRRVFTPPLPFDGPCIVKIQAEASASNTDMVAGFDGLIVKR
jgi:hypothetical protein